MLLNRVVQNKIKSSVEADKLAVNRAAVVKFHPDSFPQMFHAR